jgi:hypothetical protein
LLLLGSAKAFILLSFCEQLLRTMHGAVLTIIAVTAAAALANTHGCCVQLLAFAVNQAVYASGLQAGWRVSFAAVAWCPLVMLLLLGAVLPGAPEQSPQRAVMECSRSQWIFVPCCLTCGTCLHCNQHAHHTQFASIHKHVGGFSAEHTAPASACVWVAAYNTLRIL